MRLRNGLQLMEIVVFALSVILQTGCCHINLKVNPISGKVVLYAKKGQILSWYPPAPLNVHFALVSPCAKGQDNPCKINLKRGTYLYHCTGCQDPEVGVGSDTRNIKSPGPEKLVPVAAQVAIACKTDVVAIDPEPVAGSVGQGIQWLAVGTPDDSTYLSKWAIEFKPDICEQGVNQDQPVCQIKRSASGSSNYTVHTPNCRKDGTGTVTVQ